MQNMFQHHIWPSNATCHLSKLLKMHQWMRCANIHDIYELICISLVTRNNVLGWYQMTMPTVQPDCIVKSQKSRHACMHIYTHKYSYLCMINLHTEKQTIYINADRHAWTCIYVLYFKLLACPWLNMPATSQIYVPLHYCCTLHTDPILLHILVKRPATFN